MRILHVIGIGTLPRNPDQEAAGGLTRVAVELARRQAARGHRVVIAAVSRERWRVRWQDVSLESVRVMRHLRLKVGGRKLDLSALLPLALLSARSRFDVIHAHEFPYLRYLPAGIRLTHFHNDPYSSTRRDPIEACEAGASLAAARYSHVSVAVSRFVRDRLLLRYESIADALPARFDAVARTCVVHNGVDLDRFDPEPCRRAREGLRRLWGARSDDVVFLYSGAIAPEKGVLQLARAFAELSRTSARVRLVLVGQASLWENDSSAAGPNQQHVEYEREVRRVLADRTASGRVIHAGLVPPQALPNAYHAADVIVVPSIVQEAFCLSAAEGLAMGRPLVATRVGGLVEFVNDQNAVLVPPADEEALCRALQLLAHDDGLRTRLASSARHSISSFTWDRAVRLLDDLYVDVMRRRRKIVLVPPPAFYRI